MVEEKVKREPNKESRLIQLLPIIFFIGIMFSMSWHYPMWMDEYVFYKLARDFPDYSMNKSLFFEGRPEMLVPSIEWGDVDKEAMFGLVYDTPIYPHTPLTVMLMSPLVKGLNYLADEGIIKHIEDEPGYIGVSPEEIAQNRAELITNVLRTISILTVAASMWLIFKMLRYKIGVSAYLFAMPIAACSMALTGAILFYWDVFMMFFFVLTLYLMEVKPKSRWKYVTACCLVNTKMFLGIVFLLPLVVKALKEGGWKPGFKMALPALSILPFYITTVIVTGNLFFPFTHYYAQIPGHNFIYSLNTVGEYIKILVSLGMPVFLVLTVPILWFWKKYPEYALFWVLGFVYAWGTGLGITHAATILYSGALVWPLVGYEFRVLERAKSWIKRRTLTTE